MAVGVWTERRPGHGEDAEPLLVHHVPTGEGVAGVFDGSGGSGSAFAYESPGGTPRSGAWVGARVARAGVESWFRDGVGRSAEFDAESLRGRLDVALTGMRPHRRGKLVGSARKDLPTTMAVVRYRLDGRRAECQALWAGDSRAYVLSPRAGLQALTRDHTVETDALEQLLQDPPLTNVLCAGGRFEVDSRALLLDLPCVLVCATDGFFGYVDTPAHFECHLLGALQDSADAAEWARLLAERVSAYTADDASLSLVGLGYRDFRQLRRSFGPRARAVLGRYWGDAARTGRSHTELRRWRLEAWDDYRLGYESRMPPPVGEEPE
ncbi:serine/threonine protein phosphatase [Actinomadura craniellae]|uniref:Serine/threonine protein phosphatase n=1 Tax=Actinomadura craniellae TaxID=2231787 RepID=A0A365HAI5_9ACTN|nr:serine/threonine protein phosphatase [Actinomadura craniellae]